MSLGVYVGIDPSLAKPGLAVLNDAGEIIVVSSLSVGPKMKGSERLEHLHCWLFHELDRPLGIRGACIEGPSLGSVHREFDLGEASGALKSAFYRVAEQEPVIVAPPQLKFFITGEWAATKKDVLHAVKNLSGRDLGDDDDAADAYTLARIAWAIDHRTQLTRRCELEIVQRLSEPKTKTVRQKIPKNQLKLPNV